MVDINRLKGVISGGITHDMAGFLIEHGGEGVKELCENNAKLVNNINGEFDIIEMFNLAGIGLDTKNGRGMTALHMLSQIDCSQERMNNYVSSLIAAGVSIDDTEKHYKRTALQLSVLEGNKNAVQALVETGAGVNCIDRHGLTALDIANLRGDRSEIAAMLLERGAKTGMAIRCAEVGKYLAMAAVGAAVAAGAYTFNIDARGAIDYGFSLVNSQTALAVGLTMLAVGAVDAFVYVAQGMHLGGKDNDFNYTNWRTQVILSMGGLKLDKTDAGTSLSK